MNGMLLVGIIILLHAEKNSHHKWRLFSVALYVPSQFVGRGKFPGATVEWTLEVSVCK